MRPRPVLLQHRRGTRPARGPRGSRGSPPACRACRRCGRGRGPRSSARRRRRPRPAGRGPGASCRRRRPSSACPPWARAGRERSSTSPVRIMASVSATVSGGGHAAEEDGHGQRGGLVVGDLSRACSPRRRRRSPRGSSSAPSRLRWMTSTARRAAYFFFRRSTSAQRSRRFGRMGPRAAGGAWGSVRHRGQDLVHQALGVVLLRLSSRGHLGVAVVVRVVAGAAGDLGHRGARHARDIVVQQQPASRAVVVDARRRDAAGGPTWGVLRERRSREYSVAHPGTGRSTMRQ